MISHIILTINLQVDSISNGASSLLYSNVILSGGCVSIPGFVDRFNGELRSIVPSNIDLHITVPSDHVNCSYRGGMSLANSDLYSRLAFTRADYLENGSDRLLRPLSDIVTYTL